MSFKERLSEATTAEELREVMRDLVHHGSPNWTYHSAAHFVVPDLWEKLGEYFDDVTGKPRWPERASNGTGGLMHSAKPPAASVSDVIRRFHERLVEALRVTGLAEHGLAPLGIGSTTSASVTVVPPNEAQAESTQSSSSSGPSELSLDNGGLVLAHCAICERTVSSQLVEFRRMLMCQDCVDLLRR